MGGLKHKRVIFALAGATVGVLLMMGASCSLTDLLGGVKELGDKAAQKTFLEDAAEEFGKQESFKMVASGTTDENGETVDMSMTMKVNGDDFSMDITSGETTMGVIELGDYSYISFGGGWAKMNKTDSDDITGEFSSMKTEMTDEMFTYEDSDWDNENIKYEGIEEVDGVKCHKFSENMDGESGYLWIDAKTKLMKKYQSTSDNMTGTVTYEDVTIEAPADYEDLTNLSEEEKATKLFEIMFGGTTE